MKTRWLLDDYPESWKAKKVKVKAHDEVKLFSEMVEHHAQFLISIDKAIKSIISTAVCYVFGSMIDGTWHDNSDYDVIVVCSATVEQLKEIGKLKFDKKVDLMACEKEPDMEKVLITW